MKVLDLKGARVLEGLKGLKALKALVLREVKDNKVPKEV